MCRRILFIALSFLALQGFAQDIHFSQVINNPLHINPANAGGYDGYERLVLNYRNQWSVVGSKFNTMGFSFDLPMFQSRKRDKAYLGAGLTFFSDKAGDAKFGISQGALSLSGIAPFNAENRFVAGIQIGYGQRSADISKLSFGSQFNGQEFDPNISSGEGNNLNSFGYMDLAAGIRYEYAGKSEHIQGFDISNISIGAAMYHLNQPQMKYLSGGSEKLNRKIVVHGEAQIDLPNTSWGLVPFFAVFRQGSLSENNIGALLRYELGSGTKITGLKTESAIYGGIQWRTGDAFIPYVMYQFGSFSLGASYDYNYSTLKKSSRGVGGFEISLKYHNIRGALFTQRSGSRFYQ
jgi:type IX secretion system PorP/SprF family membrane protein